MKKTFAAVTVLLTASALSACGGGDSSSSANGSGGGDYCSIIQSVKDQVANGDFNTMTQAQFDEFQSKLSDIEAAAPADVSGDWKTLGDFLNEFEKVLSDAGLSIDDLQAMESGQVPSGVDLSKLQQIGTKLQALTSNGDLDAADKAIKASAQKECNITLDQSSSGAPSSAAPSS